MVDWTILSPTFLRAVVEWALAAVTVLAVRQATRRRTPGVKNAAWREPLTIHPKLARAERGRQVHRNPATLVTLVVSFFGSIS
jgi:hypothetical protein